MSEVVAESVQTQSDGTLWAVTVQTSDDDDRLFEIESQVQKPGDHFWTSVEVFGPFKHLLDAVEEAERLFKGHILLV